MKFFKFFKFFIFTTLFLISSFLIGQDASTLLQKIDENIYTLEDIKIDLANKEITLPAEVNMDKGIIETILVGPQGKLHETIFKTSTQPSYIQTSLLLLGLESGQNMEPGNFNIKPKGDSLLIYAIWSDSLGKQHTERVERMVWNIPKKREMLNTYWIFLGSKIINGQFVADSEQNIIRTYHDPFTIIHNPLPTNTDDTFYEVNKSLVPPKGTKIQIIIKKFN